MGLGKADAFGQRRGTVEDKGGVLWYSRECALMTSNYKELKPPRALAAVI